MSARTFETALQSQRETVQQKDSPKGFAGIGRDSGVISHLKVNDLAVASPATVSAIPRNRS